MFELLHKPLVQWTLIDVGLFLLSAFLVLFAVGLFSAMCHGVLEALKKPLTWPWQSAQPSLKSGWEKKFDWDALEDRRVRIKIWALFLADLSGPPALVFCGAEWGNLVLAIIGLCFFLFGSVAVLGWTRWLLVRQEKRTLSHNDKER